MMHVDWRLYAVRRQKRRKRQKKGYSKGAYFTFLTLALGQPSCHHAVAGAAKLVPPAVEVACDADISYDADISLIIAGLPVSIFFGV